MSIYVFCFYNWQYLSLESYDYFGLCRYMIHRVRKSYIIILHVEYISKVSAKRHQGLVLFEFWTWISQGAWLEASSGQGIKSMLHHLF